VIRRFQQYIESHCLIGKDERVLVALSGGVDSMVLAELLRRSGYQIAFAHCNFHLRGDESDGDERFVREYAERVGVELFIKHFDTTQYAENQKISIEMAARELRYAWFRELVIQSENSFFEKSPTHTVISNETQWSEKSHKQNIIPFTKIAIAHHAGDQIETFFINLLRGSGIKGLKAMQPINGLYIRPLLWASREEIKQFAIENGIQWREDRTNQETVYFRNKIRHELLPILDEIKPDAREKIRLSVECLAAENQLYRSLIKEKLSQIELVDGVLHSIEKRHFAWLAHDGGGFLLLHFGRNDAVEMTFGADNAGLQLLFEWTRDFGFTYSQCETIMSVINSEPGKEFYSNDFQLVVEKNTIEIFPLDLGERSEPRVLTPHNPVIATAAQRSGATSSETEKNSSASRRDAISITPDQRSEASAIWGCNGSEASAIWVNKYDKPSVFHLEKSNPNLAQLDADKIKFPLNLRHWRQGDRFRPLGMHGSKLVSDFFNDLNFSAFQKKTTMILTDADDKIIWIVGHRIDDRFKITDKTTTICEIKLG